jgi:hypothetical protein
VLERGDILSRRHRSVAVLVVASHQVGDDVAAFGFRDPCNWCGVDQ